MSLLSEINEIETEPLVPSSSHSLPYGSIDLNEAADYEKELQTSSSSRGFRWKSLCLIEVAAFLKNLELGLHTVSTTKLMFKKVCTVDLDLGDHCSDIHKHPIEEVKVLQRVSDLHLYALLLVNIPK